MESDSLLQRVRREIKTFFKQIKPEVRNQNNFTKGNNNLRERKTNHKRKI